MPGPLLPTLRRFLDLRSRVLTTLACRPIGLRIRRGHRTDRRTLRFRSRRFFHGRVFSEARLSAYLRTFSRRWFLPRSSLVWTSLPLIFSALPFSGTSWAPFSLRAFSCGLLFSWPFGES